MGWSSFPEWAAALERLMPAMADCAVRGFVVLALAGTVTAAMRRASAAARHGIWMLGFAGMLLLPAVAGILPGWHVLPRVGGAAERRAETIYIVTPPPDEEVSLPPLGSASGAESEPSVAAERQIEESPGATGLAGARPVTAQPAATRVGALAAAPIHAAAAVPKTVGMPQVAPAAVRVSRPIPWTAWAVLAWLLGVMLVLGKVILGHLSLWRLARRCERVEDAMWNALLRDVRARLGIGRAVTLLWSPLRTMPMTWGLLRTRVLMPAQATEWPMEQRRSVLLHELGHVRRWDCLTQLVAQMGCGLFWFNPLVWLGWRQIQIERERACDDLVLNSGAKASAYATHLLESAAGVPSLRFVGAAALAMARTSTLEGRLREILDSGRNRRGLTHAGVVATALVFAAVLVPVAMVQAQTAASPAAVPGGTGVALNAPAKPAPLTPAQMAAARKMIDISEERIKQSESLDSIRPRTPERMNLEIEMRRQLLAAQLAMQPTEEEKSRALQKYLDDAKATAAAIDARAQLDSTKASIQGARFAVDEAAALQAGVVAPLDSWSPVIPSPANSKEKIAAATLMVKDAQATADGIWELERIRPRTPEFLMLKLFWQRKLVMSQLLADGEAADRKNAANEYLAAAQAAEKEIKQRRGLDTTEATLGMAKFAVADAEYIVAALEPGAAELTPAERGAAERMLAAATLSRKSLDEIYNIRAKAPEFVALILQTLRREAEVGVLLAKPEDRRAMVDEYAGNLAAFEKRLNEAADTEFPEAALAVRFARAEAEFMQASAKGPVQKMPDAAALTTTPSNAAAAGIDGDHAQLVATVYELHLPPEQIARLDAAELAKAAGNAADFEKALAALGTAKPLYRVDRRAKLAGDSVESVSDVPYVTGTRFYAQGQAVNTVAQMQTGFYLDFASKPLGTNTIDLDMRIGISALTESQTTIAAGVKAPIIRRPILMYAGNVELGKAFVAASAAADPLDNDGNAVAYIARIVISRTKAVNEETPAK